MNWKVWAIALAGMASLSSAANAAVVVDLELSLVIDVSGSVSASEYNLQMDGYANAFRDTAVQNAILGGPNGGIAVNVVQFGTVASERVGFTLLNDLASITAFANTLDTLPRFNSNSTNIHTGIDLAASTLASNMFDGVRSVIDVSGDGTSSSSAVQTARNNALAGGVDQINGIVIGNLSLATFFTDNVIGGADAFVIQADSFNDFETGVLDKLRREIVDPPGINTVPEPSTLATWGLMGLLGLMIARRRLRK